MGRCSPGRRFHRNTRRWESLEFSKLLLERAKVAVAPGYRFGEHGDGHVRIALVENTQRLRQAVRNIRGFLQAGSNRGSRWKRCRRRSSGLLVLFESEFHAL